jgi:hypothetical protein
LEENVAAPVYKAENTAVGIRRAEQATSSILKMSTLTSPTSGSRSVGIVRLRTQATEFAVVRLRALSTSATSWATIPAPDDR